MYGDFYAWDSIEAVRLRNEDETQKSFLPCSISGGQTGGLFG